MTFGGPAANAAATIVALGGSAVLVTALGSSALSDCLRHELELSYRLEKNLFLTGTYQLDNANSLSQPDRRISRQWNEANRVRGVFIDGCFQRNWSDLWC